MRVLLTGGNGFVGSAIAAEATRRGAELHCVLRPNADTRLLGAAAVLHRGELTDERFLPELVERLQPQVVIHAAAVMSYRPADAALSHAVNLHATDRLARACSRVAGFRRFVFISSMSARPGNESLYARTKREAEESLQKLGLPLVIFRPALVFGPGKRSVYHRLVMLVCRRIFPLVAGGKTPISLVHRADVACAILTACEREVAVGKTYELGGPEKLLFRDFVQRVRKARGVRGLTLSVPPALMIGAAAAAELLLPDPPVTVDNVRGMLTAQWPDVADAKRDLDFRPRPFSLDDSE